MSDFIASYGSLFDLMMVNALLALSQHVVLRAGVFSLGTAGFASIGAYTSVLLIMNAGLPWPVAVAAGACTGAAASALLALPLARLRGVFQAVATLALVQIVLTTAEGWTSVTRGSLGINGIPKTVGTGILLATLVVVVLLLSTAGRHGIGRAFDLIREDETVAVSLGISVPHFHRIAFVLSGAIAGLAGGLMASNSYSITPNEFGFQMLVNVLAFVVLGGRLSVWGALTGALVLTALPEVFRGFDEYRNVVQGLLLMLVIIYLPRGIADTLIAKWRDRVRQRAVPQPATPKQGSAA